MNDEEAAQVTELEQMYVHTLGQIARLLQADTEQGRQRLMRLMQTRTAVDLESALDEALDMRDRAWRAADRLRRLDSQSTTLAILDGLRA